MRNLLLLLFFSIGLICPGLANITKREFIVSEYEFETVSVKYGHIINQTIDGLLIITDSQTNTEIKRIEYDYGSYETFNYLADVGNEEFIIICERYDSGENIMIGDFNDLLLIKYNASGEVLKHISIDDKPLNYNNHNNHLVLHYSDENVIFDSNLDIVDSIDIDSEYLGEYSTTFQGLAYINGVLVDKINIDYPGHYNIMFKNDDYEFDYSIKILPIIEISGDFSNGTYTDSVSIISNGEIYLNGEKIYSGNIIETPGNYLLTIRGENDYSYEKEIVILPKIQYSNNESTYDLIDGLIVSESIRIYSNGTKILLNGEEYKSEVINEPGQYALVVCGENDMKYHISFTLLPHVEGLVNQGVYEKADLTVFGSALLDGKIVTGQTIVDKSGEHQIDIIFENQIYETYTFTVLESTSDQEIETSNEFNLNYIFIAIIIIGGVLFLRKK